jgi:taspase (threonine aspartase 1)
MSSIGDFTVVSHSGDGTLDKVMHRAPKRRPVASIFVHAGAGYHSVVNEKVHLQACQQ